MGKRWLGVHLLLSTGVQCIPQTDAKFCGLAVAYLRENIRERAVIQLCPAVERMFVTLGALDPHRELKVRHAFGHILGRKRIIIASPPKQIEMAPLWVLVQMSRAYFVNECCFLGNPSGDGFIVSADRA